MQIRVETEKDYGAVYSLVKAAFDTTTFSDGTEADYLNEVRQKSGFIPELSLVATEKDEIIGQIVLYEAKIFCPDRILTQLVLSPLSVRPDWHRRGIGRSLIAEGCRRAEKMGYRAVFLCGDPGYYSRFGFAPTCAYGIFHRRDPEHKAEWCMVKELEKGYLEGISGFVEIQ